MEVNLEGHSTEQDKGLFMAPRSKLDTVGRRFTQEEYVNDEGMWLVWDD